MSGTAEKGKESEKRKIVGQKKEINVKGQRKGKERKETCHKQERNWGQGRKKTKGKESNERK